MSAMLRFFRCAVAIATATATLSLAAAPADAADTITVSGIVLDPAGNPVAGAEIWDGYRIPYLTGDDAFDGYCADAGARAEPLATTDAAGEFAFTCSSDAVFYAVDPAGRYANSIGERSDSGTHVVLRLRPDWGRPLSVRGTVLDPDGAPLPGAEIWDLEDPKTVEGMCVPMGRVDVPRAVSGADGTFVVECHAADYVQLVATMSGRDFNPQTGAQWFTGENDGATLRFFRKRGAVTGRVLDPAGAPLRGVFVILFGNCYVSCAEMTTDAAGRYRFDGLVPWTRYRIEFANTDLDDHEFMATEGTLTVPDRRMDDQVPSAAFTWSRNAGRLVVGGFAKDDVGIAKVRVAVRNLASGKWLRARGRWGAFDLLAADVTEPGARRTDWRFKRRLAPGRYGVSLVAVDTALQRDPSPRPWRVVTVRR